MSPRMTFDSFYQQWFTEMAPQWRRMHQQGVEDIFRAHLLPALGHRPIGQITRADILQLRALLSQKPGKGGAKLSAARINKIMVLLSQIMAEASLRLGKPSPCLGIRQLKSMRPDIQPFTLEEVELICKEIHPDFRDYMLVRFYSGMRTSEIDGLCWDNVDFGAGDIRVRTIFSAGEFEAGGKTSGSMRDIPMLPPVRDALLRRREARDPRCPYVFHSKSGTAIDAHNFCNRVWYPLLERLGLKKRRPYQTRHTTATLMLAAGENPEWIAKIMGHANTQMLFTVYSRYVPNLTRRDGSAITELLRQRQEAALSPGDKGGEDE